ncbi:hypothetical protein KDX00_03290 [Cobetia amphilecti]|nr:hypothetical protein KDX00_03290 [Cobetia litoralis]
MEVKLSFPNKIYRYSERRFLQRALDLGEFMIFPASKYLIHEEDASRYDNELIRYREVASDQVTLTVKRTGETINSIGNVRFQNDVGTNYLVVCFSKLWDEKLFEEFPDTDSCLIVHNVDEFCNRLHSAMEEKLPDWAGMSESVNYGERHFLGAVFTKDKKFLSQQEWRFAWLPPKPRIKLEPVLVQIGSIADIATIVDK